MKVKVFKIGAEWCHQCEQQNKEFIKTPLIQGVDLVLKDVDEMSTEELDTLQIKSIPVVLVVKYPKEGKPYEVLQRFNGLTKVSVINDYLKTVEDIEC